VLRRLPASPASRYQGENNGNNYRCFLYRCFLGTPENNLRK
jgi:hypothetical protein